MNKIKMRKSVFLWLLIPLLAFSLSQAHADHLDLLRKLDDVREHESNDKTRLEGKYQVLSMLINCEFDEQCELAMIPQLENIVQQNPNKVLKGFLTYLKWATQDLNYNIQHCNLPDKKAIRKEFAICYKEWMEKEKALPVQSREMIDKIESERELCLKNHSEKLANDGNLFAMAQMVNSAQYFKDEKGLDAWSEKMRKDASTPKFNDFLRCSELP